MKTQQLSNNLRNHAANIMHQKRKLQQGIIKPLTVSAYQHNIRQYMVTDVINPIVKELNEVTGQKITFQIGTSTGFYYLLVDFKKFAVIYMPNHSTGRIFIKFLNHHGTQCTSARPLDDTCLIIEYLNKFILP